MVLQLRKRPMHINNHKSLKLLIPQITKGVAFSNKSCSKNARQCQTHVLLGQIPRSSRRLENRNAPCAKKSLFVQCTNAEISRRLTKPNKNRLKILGKAFKSTSSKGSSQFSISCTHKIASSRNILGARLWSSPWQTASLHIRAGCESRIRKTTLWSSKRSHRDSPVGPSYDQHCRDIETEENALYRFFQNQIDNHRKNSSITASIVRRSQPCSWTNLVTVHIIHPALRNLWIAL